MKSVSEHNLLISVVIITLFFVAFLFTMNEVAKRITMNEESKREHELKMKCIDSNANNSPICLEATNKD